MGIIGGYGLGENSRRFIRKIWDDDKMVPKQAGFYGNPFPESRGAIKGEIVLPIILKIVTDSVF